MISNAPGPTLLGFDVIIVGTLLAAVAALAMMLAIYAAVTAESPGAAVAPLDFPPPPGRPLIAGRP